MAEEQHLSAAERQALLRSVAVLARLPDGDLERLARDSKCVAVKKGDELLSHLTTSTQVYFLIRGAFRAQMTTAYGKTVAIRKLHAGAHIGEIAALTGSPRSVSVVAETDGLIVESSAEAFRSLMQRNAVFAEEIAASLARNVVLLTDRLFELAALEVRFRLYAELLRLARHGEANDGGILIKDAPTHEMIAAAIGAQREAVTREMRVLSTESLVTQSKREILILDVEKLQEMVRRRAGVTATQILDWEF
ncbi:MAG: Crp/Fnr family transcriptional regulator [Caulobacteraceae bacterium]